MQFPNKEIIKECPNSFFSNIAPTFFENYQNLKTCKNMGISTDNKNVTLLELEAYSIIENEMQLIKEYLYKKESNNVN